MMFRQPSSDSVFATAANSGLTGGIRSGAVVAIIAWCAIAPDLQGQVFRSGAELRVIDVVVTGKDGRPVSGLGDSDFTVTEDGERRIVKFATPISVPEAPPTTGHRLAPPSDVWTSESTASRRIFAVVIDDLSTRAGDTAKARSVVRRFIDRVPDGDLVSVVFTGQQTGAQEFTSDKARLMRVVDQFVGRSVMQDIDPVASDDPEDMAVMQRRTLMGEALQDVERMMQTLVNVTDWLSSVEDRRKAVLFVTAGLPVELSQALLAGADSANVSGGSGASALFARLIERASLANVALYPLDYQGLATPLSRELGESSFGGISPLAVMADETGGIAAIHTNDVDRFFDAMIRDSSAYYLIGYEPAVEERDARKARRRRIVVRSRLEGTTVRSRRSYIAAPQRSSQSRGSMADHLLSNPLPGGALDLRVQATVFPNGRNRGRVVAILEVSGQGLAVVADRGQQTIAVTYQLAAADVTGKVRATETRTVTLSLSADRLRQVLDSRLRLVGHLDLPRGTYRLRVGVVNQTSHGVTAGDIDVPDYPPRQTGATGVLLATRDAAHAPVRREDFAPFEGRLPAVPTNQRSFARGEPLDAYLEVYSGDQASKAVRDAAVPSVTARIETASGEKVAEVPVIVDGRSRGIGGSPTYAARATVSTATLPAGDYVLRFSVDGESTEALTSAVAFAVR